MWNAVIFDFDGLMVDTEWPAYLTAREAFALHGHELTLTRWQERIGRGDSGPWYEDLLALRPELDAVELDEIRRSRKDELTDAQPLLPGVVSLIEVSLAANLLLGVASSSPTSWVEPHLEVRRVAHHFGTIRTRDHVRNAKPAPDLFEAACRELGVSPERAIALEDSVHGVHAAKAAGLFCVAVPNRVTAGGDFSAADLILDSLEHLDLARLLGEA